VYYTAAAAGAADCPSGCDQCQLDANNMIVCVSTGCSNGYFYALDGQCVGQSLCVSRICFNCLGD